MHSYDTLFLDRDGVINKKLDGKYVKDFSEFEFIDGVKSAISELTNIFKRILIVTNQQGIGKKIMSDADLNLLHSRMVFELNKYGGIIDKIYFCPDLETKKCNCRKPREVFIKVCFVFKRIVNLSIRHGSRVKPNIY